MSDIDATVTPVIQPTDSSSSEYSDMIFTDGLPGTDEKSGYRGTAAASAVGISYRQLDYWDRTGLVQPSARCIGLWYPAPLLFPRCSGFEAGQEPAGHRRIAAADSHRC
jgi:hypothetical protein